MIPRKALPWLVVAIAVALYARTIAFGQVALDDPWLWSQTSPLRHVDAGVLHDVFLDLHSPRHALGDEYLPVRDLDVALDMAVFGDDWHGPHAVQVVLFALTVLGLGGLLVRFGFAPEVAWLGALLWAVHPIHVEAVAWLAERKGVLAGLFAIACGHAWVRYRVGGARAWLAAAIAAAVAATWSKAPAIAAPAAFAAWDLLLLPAARRRWIAIASVGAATALAAVPVVLVARGAHVIGPSGEVHGGRLAASLGAQGHYLASIALARAPAVTYPIQTTGPGALELVLGAIGVAGSIALAVWAARRRQRHVLALLAWAWIVFVPIGQLVLRVHILVADRYAYLWAIAPCVGAALVIMQARTAWRVPLAAVLAAVLALATLRAEGAWASSLALFERGYASNPHDWKLCGNVAQELSDTHRPGAALAVLDLGLTAEPRQPYLLEQRAQILEGLGRHAEALEAARRAAETRTSSGMFYYALLLDRAGRAGDALPWAERAARRHPELADDQRLVAKLDVELGRFDDAARATEASLRADPSSASDHLAYAQILMHLGRRAEAARELDAAAADPALAPKIARVRAALR